MRRKAVVILILVALLASSLTVAKTASAQTANSWATKASMNVPRSGLGVATVNGKIYAIGGISLTGFFPSVDGQVVLGFRDLGEIGTFLSTNEEYNPETNVWNTKAPMPTPRILFSTVVYKDKIYCLGGKTSSGFTGVNEVFDPATNTWENKASMPIALGQRAAGVVNGKIYIIGYGSNLTQIYDIATDRWISKQSEPIIGVLSAVVGDKIYILGSTLQIFDPETNQVIDRQAMPDMSIWYGAVITTGVLAPKRMYVIGVHSEYKPSNGVYDFETSNWTFGADLPTRRFDFGVAIVNDKVCVIGGHTYNMGRNGYVETVQLNEQYTPIKHGTLRAVEPSHNPTLSPDMNTPQQKVESEPDLTVLIAATSLTTGFLVISLTAYLFRNRRAK